MFKERLATLGKGAFPLPGSGLGKLAGWWSGFAPVSRIRESLFAVVGDCHSPHLFSVRAFQIFPYPSYRG